MTGVEVVLKAVKGAPQDLLRELLEVMVTWLMNAESSAVCGARYGERSVDRVNARHGIGRGRGTRDWDRRPIRARARHGEKARREVDLLGWLRAQWG